MIKYQENLKMSQNDSLVADLPAKIKILLKLAKNSWRKKINFSRSLLFHMEAMETSLKYFVNDHSFQIF